MTRVLAALSLLVGLLVVPVPAVGAQGGLTAPGSCAAVAAGNDVSVSWPASAGASRYVVRRSRDGGPFYWAASVTSTSWTNSNVADGTYAYTVEARSGSNASSATSCDPSGGVTVGQAPGGAPVAPSSCTVDRAPNGATVSWVRAANDNAAAFVLRRSRDGGTSYWAGRVAAPSTTFSQNGLSSGSIYAYTVEAQGGGQNSGATTCVLDGGPSNTDPVAPTSCSIQRTGNSVSVNWTRAAGDNADSFILRRSRNGGPVYWAGRVDAPATSFTQGGLAAGSTYAYRVETRNGGTYSPATNCVVGNPPTAQVDRVLHISVDGLRSDSVSPTLTPRMHQLYQQGASTSNARSDHISTVTLPNHTGQITGRRKAGSDGFKIHFNEDNGSTVHASAGFYVASVFDVVHDNGGETVAVVGKDKFDMFDRSWNAANGAADTTGANNGTDKIDTYIKTASIPAQIQAVKSQLADGAPDYLFWHIPIVDAVGHSDGYGTAGYANAVATADNAVGSVLDAIAADPALAGTTAIVLTSDHGGIGSGPFAHSDYLEAGNYTIPFIVWGPGISPGDLYARNGATRVNPGSGRVNDANGTQPIRGSEAGNVATQLLGLPAIPGSRLNATHNLNL